MNDNEISKSCKETIDIINTCFNEIGNKFVQCSKDKEISDERVRVAENSILQIKESTRIELQKAYQSGYEAGIKNSTYSGNTEGGTKLVYTKN